MALTKGDLRAIGELIEERFVKQDEKIEERFVKQDEKIEERFVKQDEKIEKRFKVSFSDKVLGRIIRKQINESLEAVVFPQFAKMDKRFDILEKKVDRNSRKIDNVDRRLSRVGDVVQLPKLDNVARRGRNDFSLTRG